MSEHPLNEHGSVERGSVEGTKLRTPAAIMGSHTSATDLLKDALAKKLEANRVTLDKARHGDITWRFTDNGKLEIHVKPTL